MKATTGFARGSSWSLGLILLAGPLLVGCGDSGTGAGDASAVTTPQDEIGDSMDYMRGQLKNSKKAKKAPPRPGPDPG